MTEIFGSDRKIGRSSRPMTRTRPKYLGLTQHTPEQILRSSQLKVCWRRIMLGLDSFLMEYVNGFAFISFSPEDIN
jgi:hypothetical protein